MLNYAEELDVKNIKNIIKRALREDIGRGDITTELIVPVDRYIKAILLAKEDCVVCGMDIARLVFEELDRNIKFKPRVLDGQRIKKGKVIAQISGWARGILTAERVALNFLSLLSGIATHTRDYAERVKPCKVKIMDTRKTIPGLRELEKYAVRVGGGFNHRFGLGQMVLIKDNHLVTSCALRSASRIRKIIKTAKERKPKNLKLEIEVKNLREFREALKENPDIIMLDNMKIGDMKKAVMIRDKAQTQLRHRTLLEASGGVNFKNVRTVAACGVDMISIGALTHSVKSIDISLEVKGSQIRR